MGWRRCRRRRRSGSEGTARAMRGGREGTAGTGAAPGRHRAAMAAGGARGQSEGTTLAVTRARRRWEGAAAPVEPWPGAGGSWTPPSLLRSRAVGCPRPSCAAVPLREAPAEPRGLSERVPRRCCRAAVPAVLPQGRLRPSPAPRAAKLRHHRGMSAFIRPPLQLMLKTGLYSHGLLMK